jgi:hypothetical protein
MAAAAATSASSPRSMGARESPTEKRKKRWRRSMKMVMVMMKKEKLEDMVILIEEAGSSSNAHLFIQVKEGGKQAVGSSRKLWRKEAMQGFVWCFLLLECMHDKSCGFGWSHSIPSLILISVFFLFSCL